MTVEKGNTVLVQYTGKFIDGNTFDSSEGREPLKFTVGKNQVIPGFDQGVVGMKVGDKKQIEIEPEQGYGVLDEKAIVEVPKDQIPADIEPKPGMRLTMQAPTGQVFHPLIKEVKDDILVLDLNHPLAGKKLIFDVEIVEIKEGEDDSDEEDSHEHVHGEHCNHD